MPNSPMTGVVWGKARTGLATDWCSEEKEPSAKKKKKGRCEADRTLGFGPYADVTYEEVTYTKPEYARFLAEEGRRDNLNGRFTHWAMGSMADALFLLGGSIPWVGKVKETPKPEGSKIEKEVEEGIKKKAEKRGRRKTPDVCPQIRRLLNRDASALDKIKEGNRTQRMINGEASVLAEMGEEKKQGWAPK